MKPLDTKEACGILNEIMEYELAGVVRYTHSAMMVTGPYRIPIVAFLKEQGLDDEDIDSLMQMVLQSQSTEAPDQIGQELQGMM